jgi:ubiquinone/menaquinone biosynthesis C-methylase UbiE
MSSEEVREAWQEYWARNTDNNVILDEMSEAILAELINNCGDVKGKKVLEAGCGRGVISAKLAEHGADVYLLDVSSEALEIARKHFASRNLDATFIKGDILALPFEGAPFDIVWNAGVMEHFKEAQRLKAVQGLSNVIKSGGLFITLNPYDGAIFYALGKKSAERKGRWPYGPEFPVKSLEGQCTSSGFRVIKEYTICFKENLSYLSYVSKHLRSVVKLILRPFPEGVLLKHFGGYLLVTIAIKR